MQLAPAPSTETATPNTGTPTPNPPKPAQLDDLGSIVARHFLMIIAISFVLGVLRLMVFVVRPLFNFALMMGLSLLPYEGLPIMTITTTIEVVVLTGAGVLMNMGLMRWTGHAVRESSASPQLLLPRLRWVPTLVMGVVHSVLTNPLRWLRLPITLVLLPFLVIDGYTARGAANAAWKLGHGSALPIVGTMLALGLTTLVSSILILGLANPLLWVVALLSLAFVYERARVLHDEVAPF